MSQVPITESSVGLVKPQRRKERSGTSAKWAWVNPILAKAEIGYDETVKKIKIGDGTTPWTELPFYPRVSDQVEIPFEEIEGYVTTIVTAMLDERFETIGDVDIDLETLVNEILEG